MQVQYLVHYTSECDSYCDVHSSPTTASQILVHTYCRNTRWCALLRNGSRQSYRENRSRLVGGSFKPLRRAFKKDPLRESDLFSIVWKTYFSFCLHCKKHIYAVLCNFYISALQLDLTRAKVWTSISLWSKSWLEFVTIIYFMAIGIKLEYHTHTQMHTRRARVHTYAQNLWTSLCVSLFLELQQYGIWHGLSYLPDYLSQQHCILTW